MISMNIFDDIKFGIADIIDAINSLPNNSVRKTRWNRILYTKKLQILNATPSLYTMAQITRSRKNTHYNKNC